MADVKLSNIANVTGTYDSVPPTITDTLDPALIKLVADSVEIDGTKAEYNYSDTTGELNVVLGTIEVGAKSVITFQVQEV